MLLCDVCCVSWWKLNFLMLNLLSACDITGFLRIAYRPFASWVTSKSPSPEYCVPNGAYNPRMCHSQNVNVLRGISALRLINEIRFFRIFLKILKLTLLQETSLIIYSWLIKQQRVFSLSSTFTRSEMNR